MKVRPSANLKAVLKKAGLILPDDSRSLDSTAQLLSHVVIHTKSLSDVEVMLFSKACAELEHMAELCAVAEYKAAVKEYESASF